MPTTRLAPSPTGALHLGNARTFLVNWAMARQAGWKIILRIEDLDGPRIKADAAREAIELLAWLGIDWDEGPYYQTTDTTPYQEAIAHLAKQGIAYPCHCTRTQILAASMSAPHAGDHELRYPGTCRSKAGKLNDPTSDSAAAWRVVTPDETISFTDHFSGPQEANPQQQVGDFLIATKGGAPSYQLAVVIDDARQGVNQVVRGDDLLSSTARQILLYRLLGDVLTQGTPPEYTHLPIVVGPDGRRLAKRHGDSRVAWYQKQGVSPERVIGLLAEWCGLGPRQPMTASQFAEQFSLKAMSTSPITFTQDDDAWLLASTK